MHFYDNLEIRVLDVNYKGAQLIEQWVDVPGFEGEYQVSSFGRIKSIGRDQYLRNRWGGIMARSIKEKIKRQRLSKSGYPIIDLNRNRRPETNLVHVLVAAAFIPNPHLKPTVNHISGDKKENLFLNLEWATYKEQADHARQLGLYDDRGEKSVNSKLKDTQIIEIRNRYQKKDGTSYSLAKDYGVSQSVILDIVHKKTWKHV